MNKPGTTTQSFDLHPAVAYSLIAHQGESLRKSLTEAVMNSSDSGSQLVVITIGRDTVSIVDNGAGFANMTVIDEYFSTIGTPHQKTDKGFGAFRIGRLQLMNYGANTWRTNGYRLEVDVKRRGLEHDVHENQPHVPGCSIEITLYEPLDPSEVLALAHELRNSIKWIDMDVDVNGIRANCDKAAVKWTVETENAWMLITRKRSLLVHNMGVLVQQQWGYQVGAGGVIISKRPLALNAPRNAVDAECPEWKAIMAEFNKHLPRAKSNSGSSERPQPVRFYTPTQRAHYAGLIASGEVSILEALRGDARVLSTACSNYASLTELSGAIANTVLVMPEPTSEGRMLMTSKLATVLLASSLAEFGVRDAPALVELLASRAEAENQEKSNNRLRKFAQALRETNLVKPAEFAAVFENNYRDVDEATLTADERDGLEISRLMSSVCAEVMIKPERLVRAGQSITRKTWTDGTTVWVCADRLGAEEPTHLAMMACEMVAAYCADTLDTVAAEPDPEQAIMFTETMTNTETAGLALSEVLKVLAKRAATKGLGGFGPSKPLQEFEEACRSARWEAKRAA